MSKSYALSVPLWLLLTCGFLIGSISFGARAGMGLFLNDISVSFFDNKTAILSLSLAIQNLVWGAVAPFAGTFADKYGSGKSLALGAIVYAAGMALIPHSTAPILMHVTAGVVVGVGVAFASFSIVIATFGRKVSPENRSLAFGIGVASGSIGQLTLVPLATYLIAAYSWQVAFYVLAGLLLLIVPLALAVTGKGEPEAGQPDPKRPGGVRRSRHPSQLSVADFRLLRVRLPYRLHPGPSAQAYRGCEPACLAGRNIACADRRIQSDRRFRRRLAGRQVQQTRHAVRHLFPPRRGHRRLRHGADVGMVRLSVSPPPWAFCGCRPCR